MGRSFRRGVTAGLAAVVVVTGCADGAAEPEPDNAPATEPEDDAPIEDVEDVGDVADDPDPSDAADADAGGEDDEEAPDPGEDGDGASFDASPADLGSCQDLGGYTPVATEPVTAATLDTLAEPGGALRADADLGPLTKAVLLVEANEGVLPRVRYRIRYGTEPREIPPAADPVPVSFVQIDRYNLGPAVRDDLVEMLGEDAVGDPDEFGVGPHVSYCLQLQPLTGMTADVFEAARAEVPDGVAASTDCLGAGSCVQLASIPESATDWEDTGAVGVQVDAVYDHLRGGVLSPAAATDLALVAAGVAQEDGGIIRWSGFEPREGLAAGQPFVELVIESGLGQDDGVDAALREGHVMDHTMEAAWHRIVSFPGGLPQDPAVFGAWATEERAAG